MSSGLQPTPSASGNARKSWSQLLPALDSVESIGMWLALAATVLQHGLHRDRVMWELGFVVIGAMSLSVVQFVRNIARSESWRIVIRDDRPQAAFLTLWLIGLLMQLAFGPVLPLWFTSSRAASCVAWSELFVGLATTARVLAFVRRSANRRNPALLFVLTFAGVILTGTLLLMLPSSLTELGEQSRLIDRARIALFTTTSATCVTGLVVVDTGGDNAFWSRSGQVIIMCLIQIGGLGMMSLSAAFAMLLGRRISVKEAVALQAVTEANTLRDLRRLLIAIVSFTAICEVTGALLLSTMWPELPLGERAFWSAFHSVSAFCNAGFTLTADNLIGDGTRWQAWGVIGNLIIFGGLGFATVQSVAQAISRRWRAWRARRRDDISSKTQLLGRVNLNARIALIVTAILLVGGAAGYWLLEAPGVHGRDSFGERLAEAWFQSITFRTAGFNTVDHAQLQPGTKLFAIALMYVGASPGSTGGGVKTVSVGIMLLSLLSIIRGRPQVEYHGRQIPVDQVRQSFVICAVGLCTILMTTMLLVLFEKNEANFLNHLFEATSAFATVGVSAGVTPGLTAASQLVLVVTMFLGRVGPLTLLLGLAGSSQSADFEYPEERVTLG